jgi:hypothetical protein
MARYLARSISLRENVKLRDDFAMAVRQQAYVCHGVA